MHRSDFDFPPFTALSDYLQVKFGIYHAQLNLYALRCVDLVDEQ